MCESSSVMLPPDVEVDDPWPKLASGCRSWLLEQDFFEAQPSGSWTEGALHWIDDGDFGGASAHVRPTGHGFEGATYCAV